MKQSILQTDAEALFAGVEYAAGRGDWDAAHPGEKAANFDPSQNQRNGKPARRNWRLTGIPAAATFAYDSVGPDGLMHRYEVPSAGLDKPNFPGLAAAFRSYNDWLANQPLPAVYELPGNVQMIGPGTPLEMRVFYTDDATNKLVLAGFDRAGISYEVFPSDEGDSVRYGEGSARQTRISVNGDAGAAGAGYAIGHIFRILSQKGIGFPYHWVKPEKFGVFPALAFETQITETVTEEWPVPNVVPAGYRPGLIPSSLPGMPPLPGFILDSPSAPSTGSGSVENSDAILRAIEALPAKVAKEVVNILPPQVNVQ